MKMMWVLIALFVVALTGATLAQLQNENLLVTMPQGFKIGFQDKKGNVQISEMVTVERDRQRLDRDGDGADFLWPQDYTGAVQG